MTKVDDRSFNSLVDKFVSEFGNLDEKFAAETVIESIMDWSQTGTLNETIQWYESCVNLAKKVDMKIIPLEECKGWEFRDGFLGHVSNEFFRVEGVRVRNTPVREIGTQGWDQPFLTQVGFDGGILGLLRKKINGIPHYLVECKFEPGNYRLIQISPTLQATFSNIKRAHSGSEPQFLSYFMAPNSYNCDVLRDQWLSEDGGRLFNKRNKGMLVNCPVDLVLGAASTGWFRWVSLWQLKKLIRFQDAMVSPHVRGIISMF